MNIIINGGDIRGRIRPQYTKAGNLIGKKHLPGSVECERRRADGTLCPGGQLPQQRGQWPGTVHCPQPCAAAEGGNENHRGRRSF